MNVEEEFQFYLKHYTNISTKISNSDLALLAQQWILKCMEPGSSPTNRNYVMYNLLEQLETGSLNFCFHSENLCKPLKDIVIDIQKNYVKCMDFCIPDCLKQQCSTKKRIEKWIESHSLNVFTNKAVKKSSDAQKKVKVVYKTSPSAKRVYGSSLSCLSASTIKSVEYESVKSCMPDSISGLLVKENKLTKLLLSIYNKFVSDHLPKVLTTVIESFGLNKLKQRIPKFISDIELQNQFESYERLIVLTVEQCLVNKFNELNASFQFKLSEMQQHHAHQVEQHSKEIQMLMERTKEYQNLVEAKKLSNFINTTVQTDKSLQNISDEYIQKLEIEVTQLKEQNENYKNECIRLHKRIKLRENAVKLNNMIEKTNADLEKHPLESYLINDTMEKVRNEISHEGGGEGDIPNEIA